MKNKYKLVLVVIIIIVGALLSDWDDFKTGFTGKPPVEEVGNSTAQ